MKILITWAGRPHHGASMGHFKIAMKILTPNGYLGISAAMPAPKRLFLWKTKRTQLPLIVSHRKAIIAEQRFAVLRIGMLSESEDEGIVVSADPAAADPSSVEMLSVTDCAAGLKTKMSIPPGGR